MKDVGVHSVDIVKKKSSSGCLIIKRKLPTTTATDSSSIKQPLPKRPRLTDSDSSDDDDDEDFTQDPFVKNPDRSLDIRFSNGGYVSGREFEARRKAGDGLGIGFGEQDVYLERKVRKDVYDYDNNHRLNSHHSNYSRWQDGGSGSSSNGRRVYDGRNAVLDAKSNRFDAPIRLQGKNGVLKVMVKKHKPIPVPFQDYEPEERKESRPVLHKKKQLNAAHKDDDRWDVSNKSKAVMRSSMYPGSKKHVLSKSREISDSDASLPVKLVKRDSVLRTSNEKVVKSEKRLTPLTNNVASVKGKETKVVKRGSGTEKQLLREKIRSMLLSAGWTIDYRPRRNRDYLDAVYINTSGTAYWSIVKAYEALQKEGTDHSQAGGEFTPLPVETLSKLTRQTRKKIEREMKRKRIDEGKGEDSGDDDDSNDNDSMETVKKQNFGINSVQGRKSNKFGRCTLLIRNGGKQTENDLFVPYSGKRTLLSWLIDSETVQTGEKVQYMNRKKTQVMQEGWITKEGIHCGCSKILTVLKFELHAGSKLGQPFLNIYVQSGKSLTQCLMDAWNKQGELERKGFHAVDMIGDDLNDDTCGLCGDGGDLICCDGCPSTFHQSCLGIQMLPQGDWHCPNCSCKYCETVTEAAVKTESTLVVCHMCEKKYHKSCSLDMDNNNPINPTDPDLSFCSHKCLQLYNNFQKLVGVKHELDSGFSWSFIHRSDVSAAADTCSSIEISQKVECNSKLAVALSVIDECFMPITDRRSGLNLIHNVVYNCGSNFNRLNYSGFFTAVLERADEIVCAASIRIHGTQLAEMPFIGTRHVYRRQGMCRRLLSVIESALASLHVEKLIIPAIAEHMHTWTDVFGFKPLEESHKQELRSINMLVFPGTDMLQKSLDKTNIQIKISDPISPVKELSEKTGPTKSDSHDSTCSVKNDTPLPVLAENIQSDSIEAKDVVQDVRLTIDKTDDADFIEATDVVQDVRLTIDKTADADIDSKVDGFAVQICNSVPLPESDSVDAKSETRVEECVSENPGLLTETESDTIINITS
ncbi:uncharacterized protein LOC143632792 [Bidens hawaiensis]|uniref:uncharacterized protein LOC143632792 n=1 Tax=Bidens hawaiensis TaxID=980011 RepID=UPI00404A6250